jgi:predicted esterase
MNEIQTRSVSTTTHGRVLLREGNPARLLVGFHGYGENAERHMAELVRIPGSEGWRLASVQALHRFYNLKTNEVVASWMTKQDREQAIEDNVRYVGAVVGELGVPGVIVFAGFSQGAATAYRASMSLPCHGLVILGGDVPPDVSAHESVQLPHVLLGRGERDEWYTQEKFEKDLSFLRNHAASLTTCVFNGAHEWSDQFRDAAAELLGESDRRSR